MKYAVSVLSKIVLFPIALIMFIPSYMLYIIDPSYKKFTFKMER